MPTAADYLLSAATGAKPKLVITAPDGSQLWVNVSPDQFTGPGLWPQGYTAQLQFGEVPTAANVTASTGGFLFRQAPTLLLRSGPLGIAWGLWLLGLLALLLSPYLPLLFRRRKP